MKSAAPVLLSRDEARALIDRITKWSRADAVQVALSDGITNNVRFADNRVTTAGTARNGSLTITSHFGAKHAAVVTSESDDDAVRHVLASSEALAKLAPDDPEAMPSLPAQHYQSSDAFFAETANADPTARINAVMTAITPARRSDVQAAGYLEVNNGVNVVANSAGVFGYHPSTVANYTLTVRTNDKTGSGWAGAESNQWSQLDFASLARRAIEKANASRNPVAIEPGRYTVVFEAQAVGDLVQLIGGYIGAREADEGRSPFTKPHGETMVGTRIVDPRVTILSDPTDPSLRGQPFDGDGLPLGRQMWIDQGVLQQLYYTRFWAKKHGRQATGAPSSFKMTGGDTTVDAMISSTERGILVTRLWYLREVDPRTMLYTGLTRDGTFLIENGKVTHAVKNLRFNDSPLYLLNNIVSLGKPERIGGTEAGGPIVVPPLKVKDFVFTSLSEAV